MLEQAFSVSLRDLDRQHLLREVAGVDTLWIRLRNRIDREVFVRAPRLRLIVTPTTGLNHIDLEEAGRRSIRIVSLRGETAFLRDVRATAEHTVALMLALLRKLPAAALHVKHGGWDRTLFQGRELFGKTVGIVGLGRLGRIVARYLEAFGATVMAADPNLSLESTGGVPLVPLGELLERSDIVSIHVNLDETTASLFDASCFARLKPGAILINTARGELLDERQLLACLRSGKLAGAAVDVLCDEDATGMSGTPLVEYAAAHDNLIITPHIGGYTEESLSKVELFLARRLIELVREGGAPDR